MEQELKNKIFDFLDELRDSGATNMVGAGAYIKQEFALSTTEARTVLHEWMKQA